MSTRPRQQYICQTHIRGLCSKFCSGIEITVPIGVMYSLQGSVHPLLCQIPIVFPRIVLDHVFLTCEIVQRNKCAELLLI
ncbi:hypothetical protein XENTR_v10006746 [Xenopus tropicalis]|nr:hypothetical protein XENTR_v10006746 [Xenopus tropicalis]